MPGTETNNTAEYTAMLTGVESAVQHGATSLRVEGDSHLVLSQVRGTFACANKRLRGLRNRVRAALRRIECTRLVHIDRQANAHADRLANRALDTKRTKTQCAQHCEGDERCYHPERPLASRSERPAPEQQRSDHGDSAHDHADNDVDMEADEADAATAARNEGELFPAMPLSADAFPARQPRLRLRQLSDEEFDAAAAAVEQMAQIWACRIDDAPDWDTGEGYIQALPTQLRAALQQYSVPPPVQPPARRTRAPPKPARPSRTAHDHREQRLDEALDDLAAVQQRAAPDRQQIKKARRRVARIRAALETQRVRQQFGTRERECVEAILARAHPDATAPSPATCPLPSETLQQHFTGTCTPATTFDYDAAEGAKFRDSIRPSATTEEHDADALCDAPTVDEVEDQLKRAKAATSPGHDGIGYDVLKRFATQIAPMLAAAFAFCWRHQRVPAVWKVGNVRLIHKKGDAVDPSNWRPICLQPTVYKLYTGLLAQRLSRWLEANGRLPMTQKGFRPFNGCHENNFVSTTLLDQTRRLHRKLYLVWYDLRDAFGSLPQQLMWSVLADMGAAPEFVQRCRTLYADASFTITNAADGTTQPIRREVGVFQGCPLSPLLFITALAPLQRVLERLDGVGVALADGVRPCCAAYADDIKVYCDSADGIRRCHDAVTQFLSWTGLRANPKKCAALGVTTNARGNPVLDKTLQLAVDDEAIPTLGLHESYAYLGVGDGFDHVRHRLQLEPKLKQLKLEAVALLRSELAPWQILKALKVYIYPKVEYALRHLRPLRSQLEGFDRAVSRGMRHLLRLPPTATTEILYSPTSSGGLGLLPLVETHQALQVAHAWQMLHSKDLAIRAIAREQVVQICRTRHTLDVEHWRDGERREEMVQLFLNSKLADSPHAPSKRRNGDIGSLWVDVQRHLRTWELALDTRHDNGTTELLQLKVPHHHKWLSHKTVLRHLKLHLKLRHLERWRSMTDQGRTVRAHGGAGAKFVSTAAGLTDAEYRFAIQARLNQVDTNATLKRRRLRANATCRAPNCSRAETLAHVLNHCAPNMDTIRQRHDSALEQIGAQLQCMVDRSRGSQEIRLNQTVPGYTGAALRPDIQVSNPAAKTMVIADLAITFEDQPASQQASSSLQLSHDHKILKYQPIVAELQHKGWRVQTAAIIYGSLGSVHPSNFVTYTEKLGLLKREARRLNIQLSSHCIRASHRIWNWHCSQHRMRQQSGTASRAPRGPGGVPRSTSQAEARLERMRFFWPLRDRSPSTDSECSTASQSSLASDASFYSAAGGEEMSTAPSRPADPIVDLRGDPPADPLGDPPEDPLGDQPPMPCFTFGAGWEPQDPLRVAAGGASFPGPQPPPGAATSGTGAQPAAPIAPQRAAARTTSGRNDRIAPSSAPQLVFDIEAPSARSAPGGRVQDPSGRALPPAFLGLPLTENRADGAAPTAAPRAPTPAEAPLDRASHTGSLRPPATLPPTAADSLADRAPPALPDPPCARPERGESLADGRAPDLATERDEIPAPAPPSSPRELLQPLDGSSQDVALAVYAHNAALFECTLCAHTARDLAALQQHRRSAHRNTRFVDHFHSGCACGVSFFSRAAATKHARECPESALSAAAAARTAAANTAGMSLGADERDDLASAGVLHDVASPAFGSILPAALATAADAPSATATADAATQQSTVPPAAAQPPRRAHVPPVPRALSPPSALRIGGKRRRLNGDDDDSGGDLDVLMHDEDIAAHVEALPEPHHNGAAAPSARERGAPSAPHSHTLGPSTPPRPPACSKHGELEPAAGGRGGGRSDSAERERNSSSDSDDRANAPTTTQTTDTSDERGNRDNHDDTRTDAEYDNKHQRRADAPTTPRTIESGDNNDERADCEHERDDGDTCDDDTRDTCERDNDSNDSNQGTGSDGNSDGHSSDGDTIGRNLDPAI
ncbi:reverse transcriptase, partial [Globisporangium splendens]